MKKIFISASTLAALIAAAVLVLGHGCGGSEDDAPKKGAPGAAASQEATAGAASAVARDPDAENPDRGRWVDLARIPFEPKWVGGTLVVIRGDPPSTLNNLLWTDGDPRSWAKFCLYPFLVWENPDAVGGRIVLEPCIAAALPERRDDRTWIWKLKPGVTWEDGVPLTAHDYAFSWKMIQDPESGAGPRLGSLERIESVTALDDATIEVRFREPYYNAVTAFGLEFTVIPRHATPADPKDFARDENRRTLAYGPYRIAQQDQQRLVLELRSEYRTKAHPIGPHYVERIEVRFNKDPTNKLQQLRTGGSHIDVLSADQWWRLDDDEEFRSNCWRTYYYLPLWSFCAWNLKDPKDETHAAPHPLFGDVRVRKAMAHLFPRERVRDEYLHGMARLVSGPFYFRDADYDANVPLVPFDPAAARRLLADAGWTLGDDGFLHKGDAVFRFELSYVPGSWVQHFATQFVEAARKIGIDVSAREAPTSALRRHGFDAYLGANRLSPNIEPDVFELFHSSQARIEGYNWSGLEDAGVDATIASYRREPDLAKRTAIRRALHRQIDELQPLTFLVATATPLAVSRKWANVDVHDLGVWYRDFVWRELWEKHPPPPPPPK